MESVIDKVVKQNRVSSFIKLFRPKQWIKNFFVFAALIFSNNFLNIDYLKQTTYAFLCFCLISSCVYIFNDMVDVEKDRKHPRKKYRPIASGAVSKKEALMLFLLTAGGGITASFLINKLFGVIVIGYLINNAVYSFKVKHLVILDVMSIALGFLLRVISGAAVIHVDVSPWILLCTLLLSLFLGFSKRRNELVVLEENADKHRRILDEYSLEFIDHMLAIVTASTVMAYSLYTFSAHENKYMMLTIPFVLYGIFRYQYIVYKKNEGGSPEEMLLTDLPLLINVILWIISSICIISFFE